MNLKISNLSKTYKNGVIALDSVNLEIGKGMFGLLGPNGAGKSTLMRTIVTLQKPDGGSIFFRGINVVEDHLSLRKTLGYLPQEFGVYPKMSADELLDYFALLKGISSGSDRKLIISKVLEITNLSDVRKKNVDGYSGGMKQRFGIAQLLLNDPELIIVDEPTAGLDPAERNRFLNVLREISTSKTIIFSTHIVDDVKDLCHEMAIMNNGKILKHSAPEFAISEFKDHIWTKNIDRDTLGKMESEFNVLSSKYNNDNSVSIRVYSNSIPAEDFEKAVPELEDVYFISLKNFN